MHQTGMVFAPAMKIIDRAGAELITSCASRRRMNASASKLIRRTHMYSALFLAPWMIVYALSGLVLNHNPAVRAFYGEKFIQFEKVAERPYDVAFSADADARTIGAQILDDLGLSGSFAVQGNATAPRLVINRNAGFAQHRITYFRAEKRLLHEKQAFTAPVFLNRAHFRHGYDQPFVAQQIWAFILDGVIVAMVFWAASGIWMWWEIKPARLAGAGFAVVGCALFAVLLVAI